MARGRNGITLRHRIARRFTGASREGRWLVGRATLYGDPARLSLGARTQINDALLNTMSGTITLQDDAFLGHGVALLTGTHDIAKRGAARQAAVPQQGRDIVVGEGAWIASRATVVGPCAIGAHAVVAAGAVVTADVQPGSVVAGVPARPIGQVPGA